MEVVVCILTLSHTETLTRLKWLVKMFKQNKTRLIVPKGSLCTLVKASGKRVHTWKKKGLWPTPSCWECADYGKMRAYATWL